MDALDSCGLYHYHDKPECMFWNRLNTNLRDLGQILGTPFSDTILLVHSIIKQIHKHEYEHSGAANMHFHMQYDNVMGIFWIEGEADEEAYLLTTVEARDDWEAEFSKKFLIPTIQVYHNIINQWFYHSWHIMLLETFTLPRRIDTGVYHQLRGSCMRTQCTVKTYYGSYTTVQLFFHFMNILVHPPLEDFVYERTVPSDHFASSIWSFHPRQSLEDLNQSLQAEGDSLQYTVLYTFLKLVCSLTDWLLVHKHSLRLVFSCRLVCC